MIPFLKWAGGKRQLLSELRKHVPQFYGRYYEPFVGGGALFFDLQTPPEDPTDLGAWQDWSSHESVIGDTNLELIRTYRAVRDDVESVVDCLKLYKNSESLFYEARANPPVGDAEFAAWFIYMNKVCFNGLYRVNKKGEFNVPFGKYVNPKICDEETLRACSAALQDVRIEYDDFNIVTAEVGPGDLVYFDSPYLPVTVTSNFTAYTKDGFTYADHQRLAACALELKRRGVFVVLSNSSCPAVRELYAGWEIIEVDARRSINSKGSKRGAVKEVIIK
jgi:DNA adenine methylase